jgi:hypothetical protein
MVPQALRAKRGTNRFESDSMYIGPVEPDQCHRAPPRHLPDRPVRLNRHRAHSPRSDIDIGVLPEHMPTGFGALADLQTDLQRLFPGQELDLAIINRADPLLLKQITGTCRLLFGAPRDLYALKMYAFTRYQDHRRYLAMERAYVTRAIHRLAG